MKIAPNDVNVLLSAAGFYSSVMRFADAARLLIRAEQIAPTNEDVLVERARLLQAQGDYGDSVLPLKRLFLLDPESYAFHLACTLHHLGDTEEAAKVVSGLIVKPVTRMNSIARGWYQFLVGETEKAIDDTIAGMKEYAEVVDFRNLAVFCLSLNRVDKAGDALRQFIANVHQPLDLFFFVRDLEEYASRFPSRAADEFKLALLIKLREMMATVVGSAPGAAKP